MLLIDISNVNNVCVSCVHNLNYMYITPQILDKHVPISKQTVMIFFNEFQFDVENETTFSRHKIVTDL